MARVSTYFIILGALIGALSFPAAGTAQAIEVGEVAPDFEGREFFNCDPLTLGDLRGRLVLFELFSTG